MFEKWVKRSFSLAARDEDLENNCIHVHVHVLHDIYEEEIIFHEVSRQPCCLPICQVEDIRAGKQANEKGNALQMKDESEYIRSPSLYLRH